MVDQGKAMTEMREEFEAIRAERGDVHPPNGPIHRSWLEQEKHITRLHGVIDELLAEIEPVLSPDSIPVDGPDSAALGEEVSAARSQLADGIDRNNERIRRATTRLENLIARSEL